MQGFQGFLDRGLMVEPMDLVKVDIVGAQPLQACVDLRKNCFSGEAGAIWSRLHSAVDLGGDDDVVSGYVVSDRTAENFLARPVRVDIGGIEEVDPEFDRPADKWPALLFWQRPGVAAAIGLPVAHASKAEARNLKAGISKARIVHVYLQFRYETNFTGDRSRVA
ncbi:hypothetical protein D3C71_1542880 [compost metagenome]